MWYFNTGVPKARPFYLWNSPRSPSEGTHLKIYIRQGTTSRDYAGKCSYGCDRFGGIINDLILKQT